VPKFIAFLRVVHEAPDAAAANKQLALIEKSVKVKKGVRSAAFVAGARITAPKAWAVRITDFTATAGMSGVEEKAT
jgi:hypothetical protein